MKLSWTNPSVLAFAGDREPLEAIVSRARDVVLDAVEQGWEGPPFDPFDLAEILGAEVVAKADLPDARAIVSSSRTIIEYNPNRPPGRVRFSLFHEIAHLFFPDVAQQVRNRSPLHQVDGDGWQLELLCNIAAAEMAMPTQTFDSLDDKALDIDELMELRRKLDVSTEALLRRVTKLTTQPICMYAAAPVDPEGSGGTLRLDYTTNSRSWPVLGSGRVELPKSSLLSDCTAVGFTAKGRETWSPFKRPLAVHAVGIPPYPGHRYPRITGFVVANSKASDVADINFVTGDVLQPRGTGRKILIHVVNDRARTWGGSVARQLRTKFPQVHDDFKTWTQSDRGNLRLGKVHIAEGSGDLWIASLVAQHGYGPSTRPRVRYPALSECLATVASEATKLGASAHMPRIGVGQAGGRWEIVREIIDEELGRKGIPVTIYTLPGESFEDRPVQRTLALHS